MYPFRGDHFAVRNGWYVLSFRRDLTHALRSRWLLDEPVVMFRRQDGAPVAMSGLCPHRFFPLGKSILEDDNIICRYHGFTFDAAGTCIRIPGQDNIPSTCKLRTYPVRDHGIWTWVWAGDPALADPALLPDLAEIGHDGPGIIAEPFYEHELKARYQLLNDNLLDLSHLAFLHASSIGVMANATELEELTEAPGVLRSRRNMPRSPAPPVVKETQGYEGLVDQSNGMDPEGEANAGKILRRAQVFHAVTPATRHTCYYFFAMSSREQAQLTLMKEYLKATVAEDIDASEAIEAMLQIHGEPAREVVKYSDRNTIRGRMFLQKLMDAEQAAASPVPTSG
jgi:phenylpropionate dioxygenase-like ring-hydroxylating dioxygenase large terminal subunit